MTDTAPEDFTEPIIIWHDQLKAALDDAPEECGKCHAARALMVYGPNDFEFLPSHTTECPTSGIGRQFKTGPRLRLVATEPE